MIEKKNQISQKMKRAAVEQVVTCPETYAAVAIRDHLANRVNGMDENLDLPMLKKELFDATERIINGDDTHLQAILINQIESMNMLFYEMTARMKGARYVDQLKVYGNLALQFQNHTRRTAATLAEIRNPKKATFVRQANIAHNQQINQVVAPANSGNNSQPKNQVFEANHGNGLDYRAQEATVGIDTPMATVEKVDRTKVPRG